MRHFRIYAAIVFMVGLGTATRGEDRPVSLPPLETYQQLKTFKLSGQSVHVENLRLQRDRLQMVFTGNFYFQEPVAGSVYGAMFSGQGQLQSEPTSIFERDNIKRFLKDTSVQATFTTAILYFSDETYRELSSQPSGDAPPATAQEFVSRVEPRMLKETGLNLSGRLMSAIYNHDNPGVFFAEFEGGNRGRFSALIDHQTRTLDSVFGINGGEKGILFKYQGQTSGIDIWTAFYDDQDYARGMSAFSDSFNLVSVPLYRMDVDLRDAGNNLRLQMDLELSALADNVSVIPMKLNEGLSELGNERRNKGMRVTAAQTSDGTMLPVIQDEWESGFSIILPAPLTRGQKKSISLKLEGKGTLVDWKSNFHYPRSTETWYPRYGYLSRTQFDVTFHHDKHDRVASIGQRIKEGPVREGADEWITEWATTEPIALSTFVYGRFQRHDAISDIEGRKTPLEYYSVPSDVLQVDEKFILQEMDNSIRYFRNLFGVYPYGRLGAAFFPADFGQGFPTLLLLPVTGTGMAVESPRNIAFTDHEMSHQWWGNIVGWRSYRDQWLSEGFAEYSGVLYTGLRMKPKDADALIMEMRKNLQMNVQTETGIGKEKLYQVGPLVLGSRLEGRLSEGAYELIYSKGALVLRMLHYLLSDPATKNDREFFDMMRDFVQRNQNGWATTESFMQVASEHFARSPLSRQYGIRNLDWFLSEWIYQSSIPDYHLDYKIETKSDGKVVLRGTLIQENAPEDWIMLLPVVAEFSGNRLGHTSVVARGPKTSVEIELTEKPKKVRLDPDLWILSGKTSEKGS